MARVKTGFFDSLKTQRYLALFSKNNPEVDDNVFKKLREILQSRVKGKTVLDIGCGDGRWAQWFIEKGASKVCGIDNSPYMLKYARLRKRGQKLAVFSPLLADMRKIPLVDASFDIIFSCFSLMFFDTHKLDRVFKEQYRVLKPNGGFYLATNFFETVPHPSSPSLLGKSVHLLLGKNKVRVDLLIQKLEYYQQGLEKNGFRIVALKKLLPKGILVDPEDKLAQYVRLRKLIIYARKG